MNHSRIRGLAQSDVQDSEAEARLKYRTPHSQPVAVTGGNAVSLKERQSPLCNTWAKFMNFS